MDKDIGRLLIVIPARAGSHRLFCKPLQLLRREPLVCAVLRNVMAMEIKGVEIVVAVDSGDVWQVVTDFIGGGVGCSVVDTSSLHCCGTERVAEVARRPEFRGEGWADVVVNVQLDQPFLSREAVLGAIECVVGPGILEPAYEVGTAVAQLTRDAYVDPHRVKVLVGAGNKCLGFFRLAAWAREMQLAEHIGVYAYDPQVLQRWAYEVQTPLEQALGLEQVRALEAGISIGAAWIQGAAPRAIDTLEDLDAASAMAETTDVHSAGRREYPIESITEHGPQEG